MFLPNSHSTWALVNAAVNLQAVVDLCDAGELRTIDTSVQELTGDWRGYRLRSPLPPAGTTHGSDVPTHELGAELSNNTPDVEGLLTYSATVTDRRNLVVFPQNLRPGSSITFTYTDALGAVITSTI